MCTVWDQFLNIQNQIGYKEISFAFLIARDMADDISDGFIDYIEGEKFFIEKLTPSLDLIQANLTLDAFQTFKSLFLTVNEKKNNLLRLGSSIAGSD